MKKRWHINQPDPEAVAHIRQYLNCGPVTAAVLVNRNICTESDVRNFMNLSIGDLRPPFAIRDMEQAVHRIARAIRGREKILIFGDYDVDGVTATTVLLEFLQYTGADVSYYIPHRTLEGYDLQTSHIFGYALPNEIDLIITVDCGSSRHEAIQAAKDSGIDVIVTDHHTIGDLPPAVAVVNPGRRDCDAGFAHLAGVGVAFALIIALRKYLRETGFWQNIPEPNLKRFCDLVALGTVADMVPLILENRILARIGLDMNTGTRPGLDALVRMSGMKKLTDAEDIAFRLAPRINAAGRMDHAGLAVELLTTRDPEKAAEIARFLNQLNRQRQETEEKMLERILNDLEKQPDLLRHNTLVLSGPNWHEGVLGIVASRLVERFFRPVILISSHNPLGKGSGRSIPGINIYEGLKACARHLEKFGGHPMAAGLQIQRDRIPAFQEDFEAAISGVCTPEHFSRIIRVDCELDFGRISDHLIDELEGLNPFGQGNSEPLFMARNVRVVESRVVGKKHRRMKLRQSDAPSAEPISAMLFNADRKPGGDAFERVAFRLRWNRWNGRQDAQLIIEETEPEKNGKQP